MVIEPCNETDTKPTGKGNRPPSKNGAHERPVIEFPHMLRIIGPKHVKIMLQFAPSAIVYGATSLILLTYMSDWKAVLQYLPYYNGKFIDDAVAHRATTTANENTEEIADDKKNQITESKVSEKNQIEEMSDDKSDESKLKK